MDYLISILNDKKPKRKRGFDTIIDIAHESPPFLSNEFTSSNEGHNVALMATAIATDEEIQDWLTQVHGKFNYNQRNEILDTGVRDWSNLGSNQNQNESISSKFKK